MIDKSYIGKGIVYGAGIDFGNVSALKVGIEQDKIQLPNYRTGGGGNYNSVERVSAVTMAMTVHDFNAANLAKGTYGSVGSVASGTVTDESISAPATLDDDTLVETASIIDTGASVTVTSDPVGTTYVEGTDYAIMAAGIVILAGGSIAAGTALLITYTKKAVDVVEALTTTGIEIDLLFVGLNEAQSLSPVVVKMYRVKLSAAAELALIGDEFGALELTGEVLADSTITGAGLSQYLKVQAA